ncbi:MAG: hypothetical protein V9G04_19060 [Nocardioides sp.]|jgi:hypothetical protein
MGFRRKKTFLEQASDFAGSALESIEEALSTAKEQAAPALVDLKEKARTTATDTVAPAAAEAKDRAKESLAPLLAAAAETAREKAKEGATLAADQAAAGRDLAAAKLAEVKGEPEPKGGRVKKFLLLTGLVALGGVIFKTLRNQKSADNWQSSYVPPAPPPAPAAATAAAGTTSTAAQSPTDGLADPLNDPLPGASDDPGGAGVDEALSDAAEAPHDVTTPDDPAEEVDVRDR